MSQIGSKGITEEQMQAVIEFLDSVINVKNMMENNQEDTCKSA